MSTITPGRLDITVYQHADWELSGTWEADGAPVNLTPYTLDAHIRQAYADATPAAVIECVKVDAAAGKWALRLTDAQTSALPTRPCVWDLRVTAGTTTQRLLMGAVTVSRGATRA